MTETDASHELQLVHPDHHEEVKRAAASEETKTSDDHGDILNTVVGCHGTPRIERVVYVTFHTYHHCKMVKMELNQYNAFEKILQKAQELIPGPKWRIFSGTENHVEFEFTDSLQVWSSIKQTMIYKFWYLEVRQIKVGEVARCDGCYREIYGNRYKCTECADFDLCGSCEIRRMHPFHKLLRVEPV